MEIAEFFEKKKLDLSEKTKENFTYEDAWVKLMRECENYGTEEGHEKADDILCELVKKYCPFGERIVEEWEKLNKWYA